jgi:hypothetical protein
MGSCLGNTYRNKIFWIEREPAFFWGKVTLVNACMSSITLYMLSFLEVSKGFLKKAYIYRNRMI